MANEIVELAREGGLTPKQAAFVEAYVAHKASGITDAAIVRMAYPDQNSATSAATAYKLLRDPRIIAAIYAKMHNRLGTEGLSIAAEVLMTLAKDSQQPGGIRVRAAAELIKASGLPYRQAAAAQAALERDRDTRAITDLSREDLEQLAASLDDRAAVVRRILDTGAIDADYSEVDDPLAI